MRHRLANLVQTPLSVRHQRLPRRRTVPVSQIQTYAGLVLRLCVGYALLLRRVRSLVWVLWWRGVQVDRLVLGRECERKGNARSWRWWRGDRRAQVLRG